MAVFDSGGALSTGACFPGAHGTQGQEKAKSSHQYMADPCMGITRLPLTTSPSCRSPVFDWWGQWGMEQNTRVTEGSGAEVTDW